MSMLKSRLLVIIFVIGALTIMLSCSQTDNVVSPKSLTKVWLDVQRLPTPPAGMMYGLWVSKVPYTSISEPSDAKELGRFSHMYSDTLIAFLDENGDVRTDSNEFRLDGDLFGYSYLFVTTEVEASVDTLPGPMMLGQTITGSTDTIRMYFPQQDSLWESIVRCNFMNPTSDIPGDFDNNPSSYGYGLWFSNHEFTLLPIHDTFNVVVSNTWDTIKPKLDSITGDTMNLTDLRKEYPDSVWYTYDTIRVDFGRDRLALGIDRYTHYGAKQHIIRRGGTAVPRLKKNFHFAVDSTVDTVGLDDFSQDLYDLPDLGRYGWKYKGWIVSENIPKGAVGEFTPPVWDYKNSELLIPGYQGGLMTTGKFTNVTDSDESNPFTLSVNWDVDSVFIDTVSTDPIVTDTTIQTFHNLKRPRFPGEDFLNATALSDSTHGAIASPLYTLSQPGSVFISLEPNNMVTDTTNFPLILFSRTVPPVDVDSVNLWTLSNWAGVAPGSRGLPKIEARIKRF